MRFAVLILILGAFAAVGSATAQRSAAPGEASAPQGGSPVASCSSAGCHGGGEVGRVGSEHSTWAAADPHAKAYSVLFNEESQRIIANLHRTTPAHQDKTCLACHTAGTDVCLSGEAASDGVGCDACHGPSKNWLTKHYEPGWKTLSNSDKFALGFRNTKDIGNRINICAECHVGGFRGIVDHELIAAGHPRLAFEYMRFDSQPGKRKHWEEKLPQREFEIRSWFLGQVASLRAAMRQSLFHLTGRKQIDLSEQSCFACHRSLTGLSKGIGTHVPTWQPWHVALLGVLTESSQEIFPDAFQAKLDKLLPFPPDVQDPTEQLLKGVETLSYVEAWLVDLRNEENRQSSRVISDYALRNLARRVADSGAKAPADWDTLAPHYLALAAFHHADPKTLADIREPLEQLKSLINYPKGFTSPANFDPNKIRAAFRTIADTLTPRDKP
jgi:hypothetical protein